jgi:hypothetical protein
MPWRNQWEGIGRLKRTSYPFEMTRLIVAFEVLDRPLVFLSGGARAECAQVPVLTGLGIFLSRIKTILARG